MNKKISAIWIFFMGNI